MEYRRRARHKTNSRLAIYTDSSGWMCFAVSTTGDVLLRREAPRHGVRSTGRRLSGVLVLLILIRSSRLRHDRVNTRLNYGNVGTWDISMKEERRQSFTTFFRHLRILSNNRPATLTANICAVGFNRGNIRGCYLRASISTPVSRMCTTAVRHWVETLPQL